MNLLNRINNEFQANFNLEQFNHLATYEEDEGIAKSFLLSKTKQKVFIQALNKNFTFEKGEKIQTEISRKYNDNVVNKVIKAAPLRVHEKIVDTKNYFADYVLKRV